MSSTIVAISTPSSTPITPPSPVLLTNPNDIEEALVKQVEYYFSRQNLATDQFLVSQMNGEMWVPISVIANFKKVSALTTDPNVIAKALSRSSNVVVDAARLLIRPNFKLQRNTIILRDISSSTPVEEVRAIFEQTTNPEGNQAEKGDGEAQANPTFTLTSVRADIQDTWFVSFATEEMAQNALFFVRDRSFRGKPIKARMKSENILRAVYVAPEGTPATPTQPSTTAPQQQQQQQQQQQPQQQPYYNNNSNSSSGRNGPVVNGHFAPPYQVGGGNRRPNNNYQNPQGIVSQPTSSGYQTNYSNSWEGGQDYNNYYSYRGGYDNKDRRGYKGRNPRINQQPTLSNVQGLIPNPPTTTTSTAPNTPSTLTTTTTPPSQPVAIVTPQTTPIQPNGTGLPLNPNNTGVKIDQGKDQSKGKQYTNSRNQSYNQNQTFSQQTQPLSSPPSSPQTYNTTTSSSSASSQSQAIFDDMRKKNKGGKSRGKNGQSTTSIQTPVPPQSNNNTTSTHTRSVPLTAQHFPPLSGKTNAGTFRVGYTKEYRSFNPQDILGIVTGLPASQTLPDSFPKDSIVLSQSPNTTPEIANNPLLISPQTPDAFSPNNAHTNEPPKAPQWPIKKSSPALQPQPVANPPAAAQKKKAPAPQPQNPNKKGENEEKEKGVENNGNANNSQRDHNRKPKVDEHGKRKGSRKERDFEGNESKQHTTASPTNTTNTTTPATSTPTSSPSLNSSSNSVPTQNATSGSLSTSTEEKKSSLPTFADIVRTSSPPIRVATPGTEKPKISPPHSPPHNSPSL